MLNLNRSNFQAHPFHLVSPSPWPLYTSISLLSLTTSAVLSFHGFAYAGNNLIMSLTSLVLSMSFWFRDIIAEGTTNLFNSLFHTLKIARAISKEDIDNLKLNIIQDTINFTDNQLGYFLAGLIESKTPELWKLSMIKSINLLPGTVPITGKKSKSTSRPESTCTDLVVWGENLYSGFRALRLSSVELSMFKLPSYQRGVIVGLLLSDGWLSYASTKNKYPRLGFEQAFFQSSYVWSVFGALSHYSYSFPKFKTKNRNSIQTSSLSFTTRSLPALVEFFVCFYPNGKKVVPENIYHLLTPVSLAHLIMGDGTAVSGGLRICTDSFTVQDVVRLINVLIIKYRLKCTLHMTGNKPRIYISSKSMDLLISVIDPYIIPSMQYKLITQSSKSCQTKK